MGKRFSAAAYDLPPASQMTTLAGVVLPEAGEK